VAAHGGTVRRLPEITAVVLPAPKS
jgi:hypothetical protein